MEFQAMLQSWLYFGLLKDLTQIEFERTLFLADVRETDGNSRWLTAKYLPGIVQQFVDSFQAMTDETKREQEQKLLRGIVNLDAVCNLLESVLLEHESGKALIVSFLLLSDILKASYTILFREYESGYVDTVALADTHRKIFQALFEVRGWCPFAIEAAFNQLKLSTLLYSLSLGDLRTSRIHTACSENACNALQTTGEETARHVEENCRCENVGPDQAQICQILGAGYIPILQLRKLEGGKLEIVAKKFERGDEYCAISHVWGDRFATMQKNSMPLCQLQRISRLLDSAANYFDDKENFDERDQKQLQIQREQCERNQGVTVSSQRCIWMDSLCIPSNPERRKMRQKSIERMRNIYDDAKCVLVLDTDMLALSPEHPNWSREILLRLMFSGWIQRLWTLQEACFNPHVFVAFNHRDILHLVRELIHIQARARNDLALRSLDMNLAMTFLTNLPLLQEADLSCTYMEPMELSNRMRAFRYRKTSRLADEPLCIANCLGVLVRDVLKQGHDGVNVAYQRMKTPLVATAHISHYLLFARGPRIPQEGYRWAPASLVAPYGLDLPQNVREELLGRFSLQRISPHFVGKGLQVTLPTLKLSLQQTHTSYEFIVQIGSALLGIIVENTDELRALDSESSPSAERTDLYVITSTHRLKSLTYGILVNRQESKEPEWKAQYLSRVRVHVMLEGAFDETAEIMPDKASWISPFPRWCID